MLICFLERLSFFPLLDNQSRNAKESKATLDEQQVEGKILRKIDSIFQLKPQIQVILADIGQKVALDNIYCAAFLFYIDSQSTNLAHSLFIFSTHLCSASYPIFSTKNVKGISMSIETFYLLDHNNNKGVQFFIQSLADYLSLNLHI